MNDLGSPQDQGSITRNTTGYGSSSTRKAVADEAVGIFVKKTADHTAQPILETSSWRTASAARGSAPVTEELSLIHI